MAVDGVDGNPDGVFSRGCWEERVFVYEEGVSGDGSRDDSGRVDRSLPLTPSFSMSIEFGNNGFTDESVERIGDCLVRYLRFGDSGGEFRGGVDVIICLC